MCVTITTRPKRVEVYADIKNAHTHFAGMWVHLRQDKSFLSSQAFLEGEISPGLCHNTSISINSSRKGAFGIFLVENWTPRSHPLVGREKRWLSIVARIEQGDGGIALKQYMPCSLSDVWETILSNMCLFVIQGSSLPLAAGS